MAAIRSMPSSDSAMSSSPSLRIAALSRRARAPSSAEPTTFQSRWSWFRFAWMNAIGLLISWAMPAASSPTAASRPEVTSRLRRPATSRRSRTTSTHPSGSLRLSRSGAVESDTGMRRPSWGRSSHSSSRVSGLVRAVGGAVKNSRARTPRSRSGSQPTSRPRPALALRMRPSRESNATPSRRVARISRANAPGASSE